MLLPLTLQDGWARYRLARAPWQSPLDKQQRYRSASVCYDKSHNILCVPRCEEDWKVRSHGTQTTISITTMLNAQKLLRKYNSFFFPTGLHSTFLPQATRVTRGWLLYHFYTPMTSVNRIFWLEGGILKLCTMAVTEDLTGLTPSKESPARHLENTAG